MVLSGDTLVLPGIPIKCQLKASHLRKMSVYVIFSDKKVRCYSYRPVRALKDKKNELVIYVYVRIHR